MAKKDKDIDELLDAMNLARALHAKYLGAVGVLSAAHEAASKTRTDLGDKRQSDIAKAEASYKGRITTIDNKFESDMADVEEPIRVADAVQASALDALKAQQQKIFDDHGAVVDLLPVQARGGGVVRV